ncbi:MAG: hypothetical protein M1840_004586 [Geoglossum simile]|nr:MAG: hypothetical protein M1840_004586 [Geoglossum simile]
MMIRYMNKQATAKLWRKRFWSKSAFTSALLQPSHGPHWMSRGHQLAAPKTTLIPVTISNFPPKAFTIKWTRKAKFPGFNDLMAWIDEEGPVLPTDKQLAEKDPRKYPGKQWRDSVRRQYRCRELGLQIFSLSLVVSHADDDEEEYNMLTDWANIQKICCAEEESSLLILLKLRRQHSNEVLFESREPPLALGSHLLIENNDIQQKVGEPSSVSEITLATLEHIPDVGNINGTILFRLTTEDRLVPDPIKEYPADQYQDMLDHHNGHNAHTAVGKIKWQHFALEEVTQAVPAAASKTRSSKFLNGRELDRETLELLNESREEGERNAMSHDSESDMQRFYDIHGIFARSNSQAGPGVDLAKLVLGFENVPQKDTSDKTEPVRSRCTLFKIGTKEELTFFDWQVNGACQMLLRTLGYVPLPAAHENQPEVMSALRRLPCLAVHGGILADQTGLGKSKQTLLFLSYYTRFHIEMDGESPIHRPILLVVPSQVVKQWADDITDYFPNFSLLVSYDPIALGHKFLGHTVGSVAMCELPAHDVNSNFPQRWIYLFDTKDPQASKTILLTIMEEEEGQ